MKNKINLIRLLTGLGVVNVPLFAYLVQVLDPAIIEYWLVRFVVCGYMAGVLIASYRSEYVRNRYTTFIYPAILSIVGIDLWIAIQQHFSMMPTMHLLVAVIATNSFNLSSRSSLIYAIVCAAMIGIASLGALFFGVLPLSAFYLSVVLIVSLMTVMIVYFFVGVQSEHTITQEFERLFDQLKDDAKKQEELTQAIENEKHSVQARVDEAVNEVTRQKNDITHSVETIVLEMERIAGGDLTVRLPNDRADDIGRLYVAINNTVENLCAIIRQVASAAEATTQAVLSTTSSVEELSATAAEQSRQAMLVEESVSMMGSEIEQAADRARIAVDRAHTNRDSARRGGDIVQGTIQKIREIASFIEQSSTTVRRLGDSSAEIGEIIQVIEEIADQTNLLALNAAIEAARAGEQGRGFAVVADEVRKLAERTSKATKQIGTMINTIQVETKDAVRAMQSGSKEMEEGIRLADQTGEALQSIVKNAETAASANTENAHAADRQVSVAKDTVQKMQLIAQSASQSAEAVGQIASASEQLNMLTDNLRSLVHQFQLDESSPRTLRNQPQRTLKAAPRRALRG